MEKITLLFQKFVVQFCKTFWENNREKFLAIPLEVQLLLGEQLKEKKSG